MDTFMVEEKILIIDDDDSIVRLIAQTIKVAGYEPYGANDAYQGFKIAKELKPDLILLDIMLPDINGWELFKHIKLQNNLKDIPIIFISAVSDKTSIITAKSMADDFLEKPFTAELLKETILKLLQN